MKFKNFVFLEQANPYLFLSLNQLNSFVSFEVNLLEETILKYLYFNCKNRQPRVVMQGSY